ncbi:DEAD/DEAH box helicase, partial [Escherichia coli]
VLAPTRELAAQTAQLLRDLASALPQRLRIALAFGGVSINPQLMALRGGCDIMVATPGRLLDLLDHNG